MRIKDFANMISDMIANGTITGDETLVLDGIDGNEENYTWEPNAIESCTVSDCGNLIWFPPGLKHTHITLTYKK